MKKIQIISDKNQKSLKLKALITKRLIKDKINDKISYKIGASLIKPALEDIKNQYDYEEHGGTPLLGVNGISIVSHGSSTPKAIMNSIFVAQESIKQNLIQDIASGIDQHLGVIN